MPVPLLSTSRNGIVERIERGHCVVADPSGTVIWSIGDPDYVTYLRSSAKPMQATAMMLSGAVERYGLLEQNIAVACGSHRGELRHVRTVLQTLDRIGVTPAALGCGSHELIHGEGVRLAALGLAPTPLHNNCSGKHAGMLASSRALGAPIESYLSLDHPVQRQILDVVAECAGVPAASIGVGIDGCSAPNFALPMRSIARCFAQIARPTGLPAGIAQALCRTGSAMQADPWLVSGTGQFDTLLMQALPGQIIAKGGAEGLHCVALPRLGLGLAVKFESGRPDGIPSVVLAILSAMGVFREGVPATLAHMSCPPILNHRRLVVGQTETLFADALAPLGAYNLVEA